MCSHSLVGCVCEWNCTGFNRVGTWLQSLFRSAVVWISHNCIEKGVILCIITYFNTFKLMSGKVPSLPVPFTFASALCTGSTVSSAVYMDVLAIKLDTYFVDLAQNLGTQPSSSRLRRFCCNPPGLLQQVWGWVSWQGNDLRICLQEDRLRLAE